MGLALSRHACATDEGESEPCDPDHIARIAYEAAGGVGPIWFSFDFPPSRGLGFSAAARAAGAVLAGVQQGMDIASAQRAAYPVVAELEGHGDNAAPAVFGGLHIITGDSAHRMNVTIPGQLICWVPHNATTPTDASRQVMASTVERSDAVFNLGRIGLLISALYEGDLSLLAKATQDRLHQPARLAAAPDTNFALQAALRAGAAAAWLSGSGPTVAIIAANDKVSDVSEALPEGGDVMVLDVDQVGARV